MNNLPTNWKLIPLNKVIGNTGLFVDGDWVESKDQDPNGEIRLLQLADIGIGKFLNKSSKFLNRETANRLKCTYLNEYDLLVARLPAPIGRCCVFPKMNQPCVTAVDVCIIRPDSNIIDRRYLMRLFNSFLMQNLIQNYVTGTTRKRISRKNLQSLKIPLPPLEEQKRIAKILDKADEIRRKRKESIRLTDELLRSTFLDMFGDPVINPKGWEVRMLENFGEIITGNTPPRANPENYGDEIEWIKSDNITTPYHFLTEAEERLSFEGKKKGRVVPSGSILVTCIAGSRSSIGKAALTDREVSLNQQINAIIPNSEINSYFLYTHFFVSQNLVQAKSTDSMKGLVSKSKFSSIEFLKPPKNKQDKFGKWFLKFYTWYQHLQQYEQESENLFNSLLQRAFKGEL